jgi:ubiquinone/menaquinone biosynthesis C-methylase UbiE
LNFGLGQTAIGVGASANSEPGKIGRKGMEKTPKPPFVDDKKLDNAPSDLDLVRTYFEKQAGSYSSQFDSKVHSGAAVLFQLRRRLAVELSSGDESRRFLDIATGTGEISYAIASSFKFEELHFNDISMSMLSACQRAFNGVQSPAKISWTNEDAFELLPRVGANRFDLVLCLGVIAHTGRLSELLAKSFSCLRGGGVLILQSSLKEHPGAWITARFARSPLRRTRYKIHAYSKEEILTAAHKAGFKLEEVRRYGCCVPFGDRLLGKMNYWLEAKYAERLTERGGDALFKLRKPR